MLSVLLGIALAAAPQTQPASRPASRPATRIELSRAAKERLVELNQALSAAKRELAAANAREARDGTTPRDHFDRNHDRLANSSELRECIAQIESELAEIRQGRWTPRRLQQPVKDLESTELGSRGRIGRIIVVQVVDGHNVLARVLCQSWERSSATGHMVNVTRSLGPVWIAGVDTTRMSDDSAADLGGEFEVTGTKQYRSLLSGTRTVPLVEPVKPPASQPLSPRTPAREPRA